MPVSTTTPGGYGGGDVGIGCDLSIVQTAVSRMSSSGEVVTTTLGGSVLPVDVAARAIDGRVHVALASAGDRNDGFDTFLSAAQLGPEPITGGARCVERFGEFGGMGFDDGRQVVAVALTPRGEVVVQTRDPWAIVTASGEIPLPGVERKDTGHDLFHEDAGGGIACASCHAEGGEDGVTWSFEFGLRRTQDLRGGLIGTEPFHWSGDMATFAELTHEVFSERMGGPDLPPAHGQVMLEWIDALELPARTLPADPGAVERGRALFESTETACASCHAGPMLTSHASFEVRTGEGPFQVPSLLGVGLRPPYMHDGCATNLHARFSAPCGGDAHGTTAALAREQIADLVAYLDTL
jgi:mono/diheme cytochrome c family protein